MSARRLGAGLGAVVFVACASFEAAEPPADGADGGGVDTPDSADAPADTRRFCERFVPDGGETLFCRDFDDGRDILFDWDDSSIDDGGSIELDTSHHVSAPASLRARLAAYSPRCSYSRTKRSLGQLPQTARVAFDVRIGGEGTRTSERATFMTIRFGQPEAGAEQCILIFGSDDASGRFLEQVGGATFDHALSRFPRDSRWSHVEVLVDREAHTVDVTVDGARAVSQAQVLQPTCLGPDSQLEIMPGLHCEPISGAPHEIRLDNLVVSGTR